MLSFQRLDAYQAGATFLGLVVPVAEKAPRGFSSLADQLRRAALSITLNIAEGAGKFGKDSARFYQIARGSAFECAAILDAYGRLGFASSAELAEPLALLERVVAMLTRMIRVVDVSRRPSPSTSTFTWTSTWCQGTSTVPTEPGSWMARATSPATM